MHLTVRCDFAAALQCPVSGSGGFRDSGFLEMRHAIQSGNEAKKLFRCKWLVLTSRLLPREWFDRSNFSFGLGRLLSSRSFGGPTHWEVALQVPGSDVLIESCLGS